MSCHGRPRPRSRPRSSSSLLLFFGSGEEQRRQEKSRGRRRDRDRGRGEKTSGRADLYQGSCSGHGANSLADSQFRQARLAALEGDWLRDEGGMTSRSALGGRPVCFPHPASPRAKPVELNRFAVVLERFLLGLRARLSLLGPRRHSRHLPVARAALTRYTCTMSLPVPQGVRHGSDPPEPQDIGAEEQSP